MSIVRKEIFLSIVNISFLSPRANGKVVFGLVRTSATGILG